MPIPRKKTRRPSPNLLMTAKASVVPIALPVDAPMVAPTAPDGVTPYRWGWYFLSVLMPYAGILIGFFFYDQENPEARKVGRNCLLVGFSLWVLLPALLIVLLFLLGLFTGLSWFSQMMPPLD